MRSILLFTLMLCLQVMSAQTFVEISPPPPFQDVYSGSADFADVNGDGYPDVFLTGFGDSGVSPTAELYINDGTGRFTLALDSPFTPVRDGAIAFADVNGDTYPDVLIVGDVGTGAFPQPSAKLYLNDGAGNFTEKMSAPNATIAGVTFGPDIAFADVNGDSHPDVFITGGTTIQDAHTTLYLNDGAGNFSQVADAPFTGVMFSSIAIADVNGDDAPDVLISGRFGLLYHNTTLYLNDGSGNFSIAPSFPFPNLSQGAAQFTDVNGDGSADVLITGRYGLLQLDPIYFAGLYLNDGAGNFTEVPATPFSGVMESTVDFADVNGDGAADVLITGEESTLTTSSKLFINDGSGNFTLLVGTPFEKVFFSSVAFADVNNDDKPDVLITGRTADNKIVTRLYINQGVVHADEAPSGGPAFQLSPNPTSTGWVDLQLTADLSGPVHITVLDLYGRTLFQRREQPGTATRRLSLDVSTLPRGVYWVRLADGESKGVRKLVVR